MNISQSRSHPHLHPKDLCYLGLLFIRSLAYDSKPDHRLGFDMTSTQDINPTETAKSWISLFPSLADLEEKAAQRLAQAAQVVEVPAGQYVFHAGDPCDNFLLVLDGIVRVQMCSENGREIVLYRVDSGESCVLTTACLLGDDPYNAEGITERPVHAAAIPASVFHELLARSSVLRNFVFNSYSERLANLMMVVQEVAFGRLDIRLARFLCDTAQCQDTVSMTHQQLAFELGSAREVISRQLKEFERRGFLNLSRGHITVLAPTELRALGND